jgi:hypothetical protein
VLRSRDKDGGGVAEPAHAACNVASLDAVLDQAGDHDTGVDRFLFVWLRLQIRAF